MKNKNITNKPKKCGRWLFLHSRFSKIFRGRTPGPPLQREYINSILKSFLQQQQQPKAKNKKTKKKKKKKARKPSPIKTIYLKFIFRLYRNWRKEEDPGAGSFFAWLVIGLFETLICAIADDKVCDSRTVSSWALLIFLLCLWWWWPNSNFLCCVITQNGESSRDLLLSVTNRKALAPGGLCPADPAPPLKINYITTSHFLTTRLAVGGVCWGKRLVLWQVIF